ncbi:hypothetical protein NKG94_49330 [Micromonospora sp. M12]
MIAAGSPVEVMTPRVLERTFGARMEVLEHLGMLVVIDEAAEARRSGGHHLVNALEALLDPFRYQFFVNGASSRPWPVRSAG